MGFWDRALEAVLYPLRSEANAFRVLVAVAVGVAIVVALVLLGRALF
ncbi:MAG: hypothetical protein QOI64_922 [Solirubrobacteraceae bacterium]|jgi:hypothetical protein|nr:hypothetical protein [Solirubrobacteraceae bacterium]